MTIEIIANHTLLMKLVARAAELTRALELDKPAAGGIVPDTVANKPIFSLVFNSSKMPLTPHKKYLYHSGAKPLPGMSIL